MIILWPLNSSMQNLMILGIMGSGFELIFSLQRLKKVGLHSQYR